MYVIVLGIFIIKLQTSVSQFPTHMDFQKVGEVIFNNEKFNVLKPTTHVITDYFKEFMLRRENNNFPTKRIFIDNNGFRHAWSGFGKKIKSLRKTDLINLTESDENTTNKSTESNIQSTSSNENTTAAPVGDTSVSKNNVSNNEVSEEGKKNDTVHRFAEENNKTEILEYKLRQGTGNTTKTTKSAKNAVTPKTTVKSTTKKSDASKKDTTKPVDKSPTEKQKNGTAKTDNAEKKEDARERTVIQTTFFCPFLGVLTMSAFGD